jgi:DNA-binding SARP family transcriptional activator/Tfp pilus assembly protein PilF
MEFRLLGPVEVVREGRALRLGGARERSVLTVLLLNANTVVGVHTLVDQLWPEAPPESAVHAVHVSISRLRRVLDEGSAGRIETHKPGYLVRVQSGELDLTVFERLCEEGRRAASEGDPESASATFSHACALWRGPPLADLVDEPFARAAAVRLAEARMEAVEQRITADLELGRQARLVAELEELVAAHPLRERLRAQLMRALYGCGRQAEALAVFRQTRRLLVDELGVEPGLELQEVEAAILAGSATADKPRSNGGRLAQLPLDTANFTGRVGELDRILSLAADGAPDAAGSASGVVGICAVDGMAGIGKTTLALHAAHLLADRFPDGCLFIDLHGHTDKIAPLDAGRVLDRLLRAVGVTGDRIPQDFDERAALYRSRLADKRLLIVLDNALDGEQVRPLLPASSGCLVLITSRRRLAGLDDARLLSLDVLPVVDAVALFAKVAGSDRVAGQDEMVRHVVDLCGRLPLAVRIAAARLRHRPAWTPQQLADRLARQRTSLSELADGERSVAAAFAMSYRDLAGHQQRLFRLLGLHPGSEFDVYAAAALADVRLAEAERVLEELLDAHLLGQPAAGRYGFHDLMRSYAGRLAAEHDAETDRRAALTRLFDHYLHTAASAMDAAYPGERRGRRRIPAPATPVPPVTPAAAGLDWLNTERANLVDAVVHMATHGWPTHIGPMADTLSWYLLAGGYHADAVTVHGHQLHVARAQHDRAGEAAARNSLGWAHLNLGHPREALGYAQQAAALFREIGDGVGEGIALSCIGAAEESWDEAVVYFQQALTLAREIGDDSGEGRALRNLAGAYQTWGRYREALHYTQQALVAHERGGDRNGVSQALRRLGFLHYRQGRDRDALDYFQQALMMAREAGSRFVEPAALDGIGLVLQRQKRFTEALDHHRQAVAIARDSGDPQEQAISLVGLGMAHHRQGHHGDALNHYRQALPLARQTGVAWLQARVYNPIGDALRATGQRDEAVHSYRSALALARQDGDRYEEARALDGIAVTCHDGGQMAEARDRWQEALAIYTELDVPEARDVRNRLTTLVDPTGVRPLPASAHRRDSRPERPS